MKKNFEQPELTVVRIHTNDIILTSDDVATSMDFFYDEGDIGAPDRFRNVF